VGGFFETNPIAGQVGVFAMKVLHIIDSLKVGGAQKLLVTYAGQARQAGMETVVVSLRDREESPMVLALDALGAAIVYLPTASMLSATRLFRLLRVVRDGGFDILHTHLTYANILGILCAVLLRLPVVVSMHNILSGRRNNNLRENLEQFLLRFATRIIAVGEIVAADYRKFFPDTVVTLPNAVPELPSLQGTERLVLRKKLAGDESTPILLAVGRLTGQKGFSDLIAAFVLVHESFPQAKLLVAGDGKLRGALQDETTARDLREHILWLGIRHDVPDLLAASDIYVSAARWEGLSIALLEAMSSGLVPVVTAVGDAPKVITPESGILVPTEQPCLLAEAICELLADPVKMRSMSQAARARIRAEYGAQTWFTRLLKIYEMSMQVRP
jgi:glycosyltransferase involved in cell wall biosynthesis